MDVVLVPAGHTYVVYEDGDTVNLQMVPAGTFYNLFVVAWSLVGLPNSFASLYWLFVGCTGASAKRPSDSIFPCVCSPATAHLCL
jgi:hypothetical protein